MKVTPTIKQSQIEVNEIVFKIIEFLKANNVNEKNIHTTNIEFAPYYAYEGANKGSVYKGQKVEQTVVCVIDDLKNNLKNAIHILDNIAIDNNSITLDLDFRLKHQKDMITKYRELAYQDGLEKAQLYAKFSGLKIVKALRISEGELYGGRSHGYEDILCAPGVLSQESSRPTNLVLGTVSQSIKLSLEFLAE